MKHIVRIDRPSKIFFYGDYSPILLHKPFFQSQLLKVFLLCTFKSSWNSLYSSTGDFFSAVRIDKLWTSFEVWWKKCFKFQLYSNLSQMKYLIVFGKSLYQFISAADLNDKKLFVSTANKSTNFSMNNWIGNKKGFSRKFCRAIKTFSFH